MNDLHGILFAYRSDANLGELTRPRNTCSLPFGGRYRLIDFMLSNCVNAGTTTPTAPGTTTPTDPGTSTPGQPSRFSDVPASHWAYPYVEAAAAKGIVDGVGNGKFNPDGTMTYAEFCVMLYRFAQSLDKADADPSAVNRAPFTDMEWNRFSMAGFGPLYNEAAEAMLGWAWPMGIMEGTSATTINPLGTITRAEVAAVLARFDRNVLGGTEPTVQPPPSPTPDPNPDPTDNGYTTADGKPLTEENVRAAIVALKEIYPDGTVYPTPYCSNNPPSRPYSNCDHCAGWAMLCSDAAFGDLLWRYRDNPSWDEIRVGDVVEYDTAQSGHVIVVIDKTDEYIKVTESGTHNKALWGGQYFKWWLEEQPGYAMYTRYPQ